MRIPCPSGLVVEARKLKTREANILADAQANRKGVQFDQLLASVTESVTEPGPYELKDGKLNWADVLVGDRMYAQMRVRAETFGAEYGFNVPCPSCHESVPWEVDLNEVPVQALESDDLSTYLAGNKFVAAMATGYKYTYRLLTGRTSRQAAEAVKGKPQGRITAAVGARVTFIEDENGAEVLNRNKHIDELDLLDLQELVAAMDSHDCGIETSIDITCPHCGAVSGVELPFDRREYWAPRLKTKPTT